MVLEPLCRGLGQPVRQQRDGARQQAAAVVERALYFGEERRAAESQCALLILIETGFAQRAKRRAGREQPLQKMVDCREHGYWRFTLIDPTLRIESSSVIEAL